MLNNGSPVQYDSVSPDIVYMWWCPKCQVNHYTPYCPMGEYRRLANSWKDFYYESCPHCGQVIERYYGIR